MTTITPGSVPGFVDRTTGTTQDLEGRSFPVACPPDIGPKTRLVAVCGCTDEEGQASPEKNGWFLSDFYLFHHLFSRSDGPTPAQIWLTYEEPEDLVHKYTEYAHGDPKEERKVVLDKSMLPKIQQSGSLGVVSRRDLLERFLSTLREQSREAKDNNEHLLVMIFGHGDEETFGVALGGNEPNLRMEDVKRALQPNTPTTLFMTSCFSGGWLVQPNTNTSRHMNVSGITGAGPKAHSISWPLSASLRRACGSKITSAILRSTIAIEESQETEETSEIRQDPTYWAFSNAIYDTYQRLDTFAEETQIHFSAQDDQWELHFKRRSGMPLSQLKARWESLRSIPQGDYEAPHEGGSRTGTMRFGTIRKRSKLKYLARVYFSANPGLDNQANNIALHNGLGSYLRGKSNPSDKEVERMLEEVTCRLDSLKQAEELVAVMGVKSENFDMFSFNEHQKRTREEDKLHSLIWRLIMDKHLVDKPIRGRPWTKPCRYIAACLLESGLNWEQIQERVNKAVYFNHEESRKLTALYGSQITRDAEVARHRNIVLNKFRALKAKAPRLTNLVAYDGHEEYEVEEILAERKDKDGNTEYLIKWLGWREETWEPGESFQDTAALDRWEQRPKRGLHDRRVRRRSSTLFGCIYIPVSAAGVPSAAAYGLISFGRLFFTPKNFPKPAWSLGRLSKLFQAIAVVWNVWVVAILYSPYVFPVSASTLNYAPVIMAIVTIFALISWWIIPAENWLPNKSIQHMLDADDTERSSDSA